MTTIEHRRSTRHQGFYEIALLVGLYLVFFLVYQRFFADWVWKGGDRSFFIFIAVMTFFGVALAVHAVWEILQNGEFVCRLDHETFECSVPSKYSGDSFKIPIADIARIERDTGAETTMWYLWDNKGRRYWLTGNYGNPAE